MSDMATSLKLVTYQEWLRMPETQDAIEEVVNGEIRSMPPNKEPHAEAVDNLFDLMRPLLDKQTVKIRITNFGLVIRQHPLTCRTPDLAVFLKKNMVVLDGYIHSAPELVVEVLSPGNTRAEREEKFRDYESIGVPEVWALSPEAKTLEVLHLVDGRLVTVAIRNRG